MSTGPHSDDVLHHAAEIELERMRPACEAAGGGCAIMDAVAHCALHRLLMPEWLATCFIRMRAPVVDAEVGSWDQAIGRPWPRRARLSTIRRRIAAKALVHAAVWRAVQDDPTRGINRILFDEIGEQPDIAAGGSLVAELYYEAVADGRLNVAVWRRARHQGAVAQDQLAA